MESLKRDPLATVQKLWEAAHRSNQSGSAIDEISSHFKAELRSDEALSSLPSLDQLPYRQWNGFKHQLCRFRGMIQDTLGSEYYASTSTVNADKSKICNLFSETPTVEESEPDMNSLSERTLLFVINVPGQQSWLRSSPEHHNPSNGIASLSIQDDEKAGCPEWMSKKFPSKDATNRGALIKTYTNDDSLQSTTVFDFVGILDSTSFHPSSDTEPDSAEDALKSNVYTLHVLFHSPVPLQMPSKDFRFDATTRERLISYLSGCLAGDSLAAEFLLLALVARTYLRKGGILLGNFSLNISISETSDVSYEALCKTLGSIVPQLQQLKLSIGSLNSIENAPFQPVSQGDTLQAGQLQLPKGTLLVADELDMGEGTLQDRGVKNIRALSRVIVEQKLGYVFPFTPEFDFETDFGVVVLSRGKSLLPVSCVVNLREQGTSRTADVAAPTSSDLARFRTTIATARSKSLEVGDSVSSHVETDFVNMRKESAQSSGSINHETLMLRMTIARLIGLSKGEDELSVASYEAACKLDDARRERLGVKSVP